MASIEDFKSYGPLTGVQPLLVLNSLSEHCVRVTGLTGDLTIEIVGRGKNKTTDRQNPGATGENIIPQNSSISLEAGALDYIVVTPTTMDAEYTVEITSY